eukprot:56719-Eustigmatos_ZCMA.PRE.1
MEGCGQVVLADKGQESLTELEVAHRCRGSEKVFVDVRFIHSCCALGTAPMAILVLDAVLKLEATATTDLTV